MIELPDSSKCCGCEACVQACPRNCISMMENKEGFLSPTVESNQCISCGMCRKVCPILNSMPSGWPARGYAYRRKDDMLLRMTSSGGFFSSAAERILADGGIVFGAAFNTSNMVIHVAIDSLNDLDMLRRSKYVQSRIGDSFKLCKEYLDAGRRVLFCGTPCQIKALRLFLGRVYPELVAIDFVCHGVPSPGVFRRYLVELAASKGGKVNDIKDINFRSKELGGAYSFSFSFSFKGEHFVENPNQNLFLKGFLSDVYLRSSCHSCSAKSFSSGADYTMCDFWTVGRLMPDIIDSKVLGCSQVFVREDKLGIFDRPENRDALIREFKTTDNRFVQIWALKSVPCPRRRRLFFENILGGMAFSEAVNRFSRKTFMERWCAYCSIIINRILRILGRA